MSTIKRQEFLLIRFCCFSLLYNFPDLILSGQLLGKCMDDMATWKDKSMNESAAQGALNLFNKLAYGSQLNQASAPLAGNLCVLAKKLVEG